MLESGRHRVNQSYTVANRNQKSGCMQRRKTMINRRRSDNVTEKSGEGKEERADKGPYEQNRRTKRRGKRWQERGWGRTEMSKG